ncbi:unnamed protein product [Adineta ricciae]|uniref:Carboxylic ester hydrolase n=1 Tax=Adineta ricciae TaxID=249248 RepID=A0A815I480_ADIRI|nr:unnamed protein product [Adineta ricciae]
MFLLLIAVCINARYGSSAQLLINTSSLGLIQGEINPVINNVRQFIGIPFAQPPVGTLRFKPPVALVNISSSGVYNATGAAHQGGFPVLNCMQISLENSSEIYGQEDCLYLDIFLPLNINNGTLLPVVVYIYGGGFETSDPHSPTALISLYQNVIYVAIRYRVNVFGFMASTALSASRPGPIQSSGLQGFEDQQMAIKWVRDNIQSFGGNPNSITIQGHSAGSISVCLHLIAPASQNLFQRAIMQSGGCDMGQVPLSYMKMIGDDISSYFCNSSLSNMVSCLQSIDSTNLLQYAQSKGYLNFFAAVAFHPLVDGLVIPDSITKLFRTKTFPKNISLLTGTTNAEFGLFIAGGFEPGWQVRNVSQTVLSQWIQIYSKGQSAYLNTTYNPYVNPYVPPILLNYYGLTDALSTGIMQCPVRRIAAYLTNNGNGSVYLYSFNYIPLSSPFADLSQSVHGQELPFVFNMANSSPLTQIIFPVNTFNTDEQILAWAMSLLWIRFIVNGNPNTPLNNETTNPLINQLSQLGGWPTYSTTNASSYIIISNTVSGNSSATIQLATSGYHSPTCAAWDVIVANLNITKLCNIGYTGSDCTKTNSAIFNTLSFFRLNPILILMYFASS